MSGKISQISLLERAFDIITRLQSGERLTARKIADDYDLSLRAAYRIMLDIEIALPVRRIGQINDSSQLVWNN